MQCPLQIRHAVQSRLVLISGDRSPEDLDFMQVNHNPSIRAERHYTARDKFGLVAIIRPIKIRCSNLYFKLKLEGNK